jgi:PTH1 family peptidyl-tRNA hydrolase
LRRGAAPGQPVELLVVGLGNPGSEYAFSRHNAGYLVIDELAQRHGFLRAKRGYSGRYAAGSVGGRGVGLLIPTTYMNDSGRSVAAALRDLHLRRHELLVVHDHIDLPFGRLRLTQGGGHGGHNGIRSLFELVGRDFDHVRMGVGRPASTDPDVVADYVLNKFEEPRAEVEDLVRRAADAAELWVAEGIEAAMNEVNAG